MFCHKCGKELPEGSKFCPSCGAQQQIVVTAQQDYCNQSVKKKSHPTVKILIGTVASIAISVISIIAIFFPSFLNFEKKSIQEFSLNINRNSRHLILTTRVLVLCTVLLYSTHSLQFVFTRSVLYCGWTLHFKLRIYFVHLFYRLRGQQVFRKYLNNLILEY